MKVYEAIAQALLAEHDGPIFGLMGDGNMSLWGALGREPRADDALLAQRSRRRRDGGRLFPRHRTSSASRPSPAVPA